MNQMLKMSLLVLPLLAVPPQVHAWGCGPVTIDAGFNYHFKISCGCPAMAAPWYSYWPYDGQCQMASAGSGMCFPYWPTAGAGGVIAPTPGLPAGLPPGLPGTAPLAPPPTSTFQPASYSSPAPSYWYGR
jgi:hypothetical protein